MTESSFADSTVAPIWRRLAALFYDCFIIGALGLCYAALATAIAKQLGTPQTQEYELMIRGAFYQAGLILTIALYYCWCWFKKGQTIGMKTWRIKAVSLDEQSPRLSWSMCASRAFFGFWALFLGGVGYWYSFFNKNHDCLHDRLSRTRVVVEPKSA